MLSCASIPAPDAFAQCVAFIIHTIRLSAANTSYRNPKTSRDTQPENLQKRQRGLVWSAVEWGRLMWQLQLHAHLKLNKSWESWRWSAPSRGKSHLNGNKCCVQTIYKNQFYNVMRSGLHFHVWVSVLGGRVFWEAERLWQACESPSSGTCSTAFVRQMNVLGSLMPHGSHWHNWRCTENKISSVC